MLSRIAAGVMGGGSKMSSAVGECEFIGDSPGEGIWFVADCDQGGGAPTGAAPIGVQGPEVGVPGVPGTLKVEP